MLTFAPGWWCGAGGCVLLCFLLAPTFALRFLLHGERWRSTSWTYMVLLTLYQNV